MLPPVNCRVAATVEFWLSVKVSLLLLIVTAPLYVSVPPSSWIV